MQSRKPRVLYYTTAGFLEQSLSLLRPLSRGADVHLLLELSPEAWFAGLFDVPPLELPSGVTGGDAILKERVPTGVRANWQRLCSFNLVVHNCRRSLHPRTWWVSRQAAQFIRALKPDVIHLENVSLRMAPGMWLLRDTPVVLTVHDPEPHSGEDNWRTRLGRRMTFPTVKKFILYNSSMRERFCALQGLALDRVESMQHGVLQMSREWQHEVAPEEERVVLFFGRLSRYKGLEVLYRAAPLVAERVPEVRFIVAGGAVQGYMPPQPPRLANGGSVEVIDRYLHNAEVAQLFERCALVACPYIDATQSGVVLTAFAFGKTVIASRVGGLPEYVEDGVTGRLIEAGDSSALAEALVELLLDPPQRQEMSANIRQRVQTTFSWDPTAAKLLSVYEHIREA